MATLMKYTILWARVSFVWVRVLRRDILEMMTDVGSVETCTEPGSSERWGGVISWSRQESFGSTCREIERQQGLKGKP